MTTYIAANNARAKLSAGLGGLASDVTVTISGVDASKFPAINNAGATPAEYSYLTLQDAAGHVEHMKISRHDTASASLTVVRGTAAGIVGTSDSELRAWSIGDSAAITLNAQLVNDAFVAAISAEAVSVDAEAAASAAGVVAANALAAASAAIVTANEAKVLASTFFAGGGVVKIPFAMASAPTGWTQDVSDNANNRMLRVVSTAGGGVAGTDSPILNNIVPSHLHGVNINSGYESADHAHLMTNTARYNIGGDGPLDTVSHDARVQDGVIEDRYTAGVSANHYHNVAGTTQAAGGAGWAPRYINLIICSKN